MRLTLPGASGHRNRMPSVSLALRGTLVRQSLDDGGSGERAGERGVCETLEKTMDHPLPTLSHSPFAICAPPQAGRTCRALRNTAPERDLEVASPSQWSW